MIKEVNEYDVDFLFILIRPEFSDYVEPLISGLNDCGFLTKTVYNVSDVESNPCIPRVVVCTNETPLIAAFPSARTVLLGHSIYMRDTVPTPLQQGVDCFLGYDFYFCPSVYYVQWTILSLLDSATFSSQTSVFSTPKTLIPGGYAKEFRRPEKSEQSSAQPIAPVQKSILYAPSVFSPDHTGHLFHEHGAGVLGLLCAVRPAAQIICRPHPTDRGRDYVNILIQSFANHPQVRFDLSDTPSGTLYHVPDIVVTDMSGFGFAFALATGLRPIFLVSRIEAEKHRRFAELARRFGRLAHDFGELLVLVRAQLNQHDSLNAAEYTSLAAALYSDRNTPEATVADLRAIADGRTEQHWLVLPLAILGAAPLIED